MLDGVHCAQVSVLLTEIGECLHSRADSSVAGPGAEHQGLLVVFLNCGMWSPILSLIHI